MSTSHEITHAVTKMIDFYEGNFHDIDHFLKVWSLAKTIGEQESLSEKDQTHLEFAAIVHDISCPLCRKKYGNTNGKHQEEESAILIATFFSELSIPDLDVNRISWLVSHHHTYTNVDGPDHQILLEADYLVNASESNYHIASIRTASEKIFRTHTGKTLLISMFLTEKNIFNAKKEGLSL